MNVQMNHSKRSYKNYLIIDVADVFRLNDIMVVDESKDALIKIESKAHEPHALPRSKPHDHHIPLLPNIAYVNVKPYH
ncbi:hypothetical protein CR513_12483, partial [Mucuna pruriens]